VFWTCKPVLRCRLSKGALSSGKPQGVGILEWGGNGEGMEMGRSVYEQPGTKVDGILSQQGGFPSKLREWKRRRGICKGKSKGIAPLLILSICIHVNNSCRM
jgi:hypothetical protein